MSRGRVAAILAALGAAGGCAGPDRSLSPEQLSAIQTVEIDAPRDDVFRAAAGVMIDRGMMVSMSDYGAGLLAGELWAPNGGGGGCGCPDCQGGASSASLLVWVRSAGPRQSQLRVALDQPDPVRRFADDVRVRCLAAAPPPRATP